MYWKARVMAARDDQMNIVLKSKVDGRDDLITNVLKSQCAGYNDLVAVMQRRAGCWLW